MNGRLIVVLAMLALPASAARGAPKNVALGAPYTVTPAPNYPACTDPGDSTQLTDGKHASWGFWTDKRTVGWVGETLVTVTLDLGAPFEIRGASFSTAAGAGDVQWPSVVLVLGSLDGRAFGVLGDLVALDPVGTPRANGLQRHTFAVTHLGGQARFVRFMVGVAGPYAFTDEIEVFGEPALTPRAPRETTTDTDALFWQLRAAPTLRREVERRLHEARVRVSGSGARERDRALLLERLNRLDAQLSGLPSGEWSRVSAQYPMNALHTGAFAVIGALEQAVGAPPLRAWAANAWDALEMTTPAPLHPGGVDVALMNGEVRSVAVNVRNSSARALKVAVDVGGVDVLERGFVEARAVAWSGDEGGRPVAAALLPPAPERTRAVLDIPAGVTRQVWLTFSPTKLPRGTHKRIVRISSPGVPEVRLPASVRVLGFRFPAAPRLHVGGWEYLHERGAAVPTEALDAAAALLRSFGVDLPWANSAAMPFGAHDQDGRMTRAPDTALLDGWLARWPRASRYRVYVSARDDASGIRRGTTAFAVAVAAWARFWAAHVASRGIDPGSVDLLFVDEPHGPPELADRQEAWARALNTSGAGFRVWLDPTYADPDHTPPGLTQTAATLCLNRRLVEQSGDPYRRFAAKLLAERKTVELYATGGPISKMDPYAYHRLMAWRAFDLNATAVSFWSFTDWGSGSAWREYLAPRRIYSPLFLDGASLTPAKHLYAIREGAEDYEYLALLRDAIAREAQRRPPGDRDLASARATLASVVPRVLAASRPAAYGWSSGADRTAADVAREELAQALERLSTAPPLVEPRQPPARGR